MEEDIKILEKYLKDSAYKQTDSDFFKDGGWEIVDLKIPKAIEQLLQDYTRQKQINEQHQKINGELREKVTKLEEENRELMSEYHNRIQEKIDLEQDLKILEQKIKDKIEELRNEKEQLRIEKGVLWDSGIYKIDLKIEILQELLQESEDK